jgi:hypothetical protein
MDPTTERTRRNVLNQFERALENGAEYSEIRRTFGLLAAQLGIPGRDLLGLLNRAYKQEDSNA